MPKKGKKSSFKGDTNNLVAKAGGGPIIARAGGGPIIARAGGGPIILRAGGGPIIPRFAGGASQEYVGGKRVVGMGWHPDVPDRRDRSLDHKSVQEVLHNKKSQLLQKSAKVQLPAKVDNRAICSPIENQGTLGSCTAHAVVGMMEYMMRRSQVPHVDSSRLFLYKVTRKLLGWTGDTGAYIRNTIQAVALFGVPPENHWPYDIHRFEEEPSAFHYQFAANYKALNYTRLDPKAQSGPDTLKLIKSVLAANYVIAFGFPVYSSLSALPDIPVPSEQDSLTGGHAVLAVGYDDNHMSTLPDNTRKKVGSLIIRNSWGEDWGDNGYGYLPYEYVEEELAVDFWTIFKSDWIDSRQFK